MAKWIAHLKDCRVWARKQDKGCQWYEKIWVLWHEHIQRNAPRFRFGFLFFCFFCFLNLLMDDNLSPCLRLTCLWVTLTLTEVGKLIYGASLKLYHGDEWRDPLLRAAAPVLQPWWMTNYTLVSHCLMNVKCQVCDVCVCARALLGSGKEIAMENWVKALCYNLSLAFKHRSHPRQHDRTYCTDSHTHPYICTHTACHVLSRCSSFLLYCSIPVPISLPGDWGPGPELPQAPIWIKPS